MSNKIEELINECRQFIPLDGRVLVHALKIRQVKQEDYSFELADTKANIGKDPSKHRVDLKKIQPKINAKYQKAVVLQIPFDENRFKPGDTVIYPIGSINPFDLLKGVSILRKYDIACVIVNNGIDEEERYLSEHRKPVTVGEGLLGGVMAASTTMVSGYTV